MHGIKLLSTRVISAVIATTIPAISVSHAKKPPPPPLASPMRVHALRLRPDQDLLWELKEYARIHKLKAAVVVTCVGSLKKAALRFANQPGATEISGPLEIVSLVGTLTGSGGHLHLSVSDKEGRTLGGHLMDGSRIFTTAEIALGELESLEFTRELDEVSTYKELVVRTRKKAKLEGGKD